MSVEVLVDGVYFLDAVGKCSSTIPLRNLTGAPVSYKMRVTHANHLAANPPKGTIEPNGTVEVKAVTKGDVETIQADGPRLQIQITDGSDQQILKKVVPCHFTAPAPGARYYYEVGGVVYSNIDAGKKAAEPSPAESPAESPASSPTSELQSGSFSISIQLGALQCKGVSLPGQMYEVHWKRGQREGKTQPKPPTGDKVQISEAVEVTGCVPVYKEGRVVKKFLAFTVLEDGQAIGTVKINASECTPGKKTVNLPIKLTCGGGPEQAASLGLTVDMAPEAEEPSKKRAVVVGATEVDSDTAPASSSSPPAGKRTFLKPVVPVASSTPDDVENPLMTELSPAQQLPTDQAIQVIVRVRPESPGTDLAWKIESGGQAISDDERSYDYDIVLSPDKRNNDVWEIVGPRFVDAVTGGINGTIFMYGQTGSGKTHTMFGEPDEPGLTPMLFNHLFERIAKLTTDTKSFEVHAAYFEIYNEELNDLLPPEGQSGKCLQMRQNKDGTFYPDKLQTYVVRTMDDCHQLLMQGAARKKMGKSELNQRSSRSHTIFQVNVKCFVNAAGKKSTTFAQLNLCDLAGSEAMMEQSDSGQKKETSNINKSLYFLTKVINELSRNLKFVSYRNSTLTKVLKQSLGGNARTSVIVTMTPARDQHRQSKLSLHFGTMARTIKNRVRVNAEMEDQGLKDQVKRLKATVANQQQELDLLRQLQEDYTKLVSEYEALQEENELLRKGASRQRAMSKRLGLDSPGNGGHENGAVVEGVPIDQPVEQDDPDRYAREDALQRKLNEKDREIIDLKLAHKREMMEKSLQLQKALSEKEQLEQEETALELMQKDDRLDQLVYQILSFLHYGTKVQHVNSKGEVARRFLFLLTEDGKQSVCLCPLNPQNKGQTEQVLEKIAVRDIKEVIMGQYGSAFVKANLSDGFSRSFSVVAKKGKRIDVMPETQSDFEAWIQTLNHLTGFTAEWGSKKDISGLPEVERLDADERKLCSTMHIFPADYLHARSQVLNKEGRFVTLFDVRTLSCQDIYHSQKLFAFFMSKGWIRKRQIYYLDSDAIVKAGIYEAEYDDDATAVPSSNSVHPVASTYSTSSAQPTASTYHYDNSAPAVVQPTTSTYHYDNSAPAVVQPTASGYGYHQDHTVYATGSSYQAPPPGQYQQYADPNQYDG